jgi:ribosome biogenesis GTPase / thiamine phosphate phosphatase
MFDLGVLGWDDEWRELTAPYAECAEPGRVARVDRGVCSVLTAHGQVRATLGGGVLDAMAANPVNGPCTGDWCVVREWPDGPLTIEALLPRRTAIVRAGASRTSLGQALAVNHDFVGVVVALHPEPNIARLERLLALAWESGATPVVLLTKADLVTDGDLIAEDVEQHAPGVEVICTSTTTGLGIDRLREIVGGSRTIALIGSSGHGKSSIVNALAGAEVLATKAIRDDGKGRHTSVRRELVVLPGGGAVVDTPGLRTIGLQDAEGGLAATFPEVEALVVRCKFTDCQHNGEPGCAVAAALEAGDLSVQRYESWQSLQREMRWMATRADARLQAERRREWKAISKHQRSLGKRRQ